MKLYSYIISYDNESVFKYKIIESNSIIIKEDDKYYYCEDGEQHLKYYCNNQEVNHSVIIENNIINHKLFVHYVHENDDNEKFKLFQLKAKTLTKNIYINTLDDYKDQINKTIKKLKK